MKSENVKDRTTELLKLRSMRPGKYNGESGSRRVEAGQQLSIIVILDA